MSQVICSTNRTDWNERKRLNKHSIGGFDGSCAVEGIQKGHAVEGSEHGSASSRGGIRRWRARRRRHGEKQFGNGGQAQQHTLGRSVAESCDGTIDGLAKAAVLIDKLRQAMVPQHHRRGVLGQLRLSTQEETG